MKYLSLRSFRSLLLIMIPFTVISSGCLSEKNELGNDQRLNFIIIYTDELQFSDLGCYGGKIPTPHIDQLAREGLMFTRAYTTASMCTPSRYSVLTGQFPGRCTADSFLKDNPVSEPYNIAWNTWITEDKITLARVLGNHGFVTGMAGKWHVGSIPAGTELPAFSADDLPGEAETNRKLSEQQQIFRELVRTRGGFDEAHSVVWSNYDNHQVESLRFHNFPWMAKGAIRFLENRKGKEDPFFLYLATTAVHGPNHVADLDRDVTFTPAGKDPSVLSYQMNVDSLKKLLTDVKGGQRHRYAGMAQTDHLVGLVRKKLKEIGKEGRTVIMFMADHNMQGHLVVTYDWAQYAIAAFGQRDRHEEGMLVSFVPLRPRTRGRMSFSLKRPRKRRAEETAAFRAVFSGLPFPEAPRTCCPCWKGPNFPRGKWISSPMAKTIISTR